MPPPPTLSMPHYNLYPPQNFMPSFTGALQPKPQALMANSDSASSVNWYPDSGASYHVTYSAQNIHQTTPFEGPDQIYIGNGQGLPVISSGSSQFFSPLNPKFRFVLSNLLHVPHTTKNLISVSQFAKDDNVFFEFHADSCYVKSQASNESLLKGVLDKDGLYKFSNFCPPLNGSTCPSSSSSSATTAPSILPKANNVSVSNSPIVNTISAQKISFATWHSRLGHPSSDVQRIVLNLCNIPFNNKTRLDFFSSCCLGKAHRLPSTPSQTTYCTPLELVYTDLWGPAPYTYLTGYTYYITFVDAFTRFSWIYLLKKKSEAVYLSAI
jgi:hypothetical protein